MLIGKVLYNYIKERGEELKEKKIRRLLFRFPLTSGRNNLSKPDTGFDIFFVHEEVEVLYVAFYQP